MGPPLAALDRHARRPLIDQDIHRRPANPRPRRGNYRRLTFEPHGSSSLDENFYSGYLINLWEVEDEDGGR